MMAHMTTNDIQEVLSEIAEDNDQKIFVSEEIHPSGFYRLDWGGQLIVGWEATSLLKELSELVKENPDAFGKESADIRISSTIVKFLQNKLSAVYLNGAKDQTIPLRIGKILQVLSRHGFEIKLGKAVNFTDIPELPSYSASYGDFDGYGVHFQDADAAIAAIAEVIERWALGSVKKPDDIRKASYSDLRGDIFPNELLYYFLPETQDRNKNRNMNIQQRINFWVQGIDWISKNACWLPAQLVFWRQRFQESQHLAPITTNGCACGPNFKEAALRALLELIERDAFLVSWMRMNVPSKFSLASILQIDWLDERLRKFVEDVRRYRLELNLVVLPTDFPVSVICCVIRDPSGIGPAVSIGANADFSIESAITGALLEAFVVYRASRFRKATGACRLISQADAVAYTSGLDPIGRLDLWAQAEMFKKIDWFLSGKEIGLESISQSILPGDATSSGDATGIKLALLCDFLKRKNYHLFFYVAPQKILQRLGFWVVRAIVPELVPLYLSEEDAPLSHPRLHSLPNTLGFNIPDDRWNPVPHPFP